MSAADAKRHFGERCAEVDVQGSIGGEKDPGGADGIMARFQLQFKAIVASQTSVGKEVFSTLGDVFRWHWGTQKQWRVA